MSEGFAIQKIKCHENPMLAEMRLDGVPYDELLDNAYEKVVLAWTAMMHEKTQNDQRWRDFYDMKDDSRREIARLKRRAATLCRENDLLRHAYRYQVSDLLEMDDEWEIIETVETQIKTLESMTKRRLTRAGGAEKHGDRERFYDALETYKDIISEYCKARIRRFDPDFSPGDPVSFRWKWDLRAIAVYYGGSNGDEYENGHGHAEFSAINLRMIYLRPAFFEHNDWVIRKGRLKGGKAIEEEWPESDVDEESSVFGGRIGCRLGQIL